MKLLQTSDFKKHHHFLVDQPGSRTTTSENHSHEVVADTINSRLVLTEELKDLKTKSHSHEIIELVIKPPPTKPESKADSEIVNDVMHLWKSAKAEDEKFVKAGKESEAFVAGEHWTTEELADLKLKNRAPSIVPEIEPKLDILSGYQRQNRFDIKFFPVEGGDVRVADILTALCKHDLDQNNYEFEESQVFDDAVITGRGIFQMMIDRDEDLMGKIKIERYPWDGARFGPHEKLDRSDCEYLHKTRWFSKAKIKQMWPKKAEMVDKLFLIAGGKSDLAEVDEEGDEHTQYKKDQYAHGESIPATNLEGDEIETIDIAKKEVLVMECWRVEHKRTPVLFNTSADIYQNGDGIEESDLKAVEKDIPGFKLIYRHSKRYRITTVATRVLLEDGYASQGEEDFTLIPVYGKKRGKRIWGKVEPLKYLQKEVDKLHSKALDILDKAGGYGWYYFPDTFANAQEEQKWKETRATAGFEAKISSQEKKPLREEGVRFPVELTNMLGMTSDKMKEASNIIWEMQGLNTKAESGVAIAEKKQQGLIGNEFLFDNLRLAKKLIGLKYLKMVPVVYTAEKILRVISSYHQRTPVKVTVTEEKGQSVGTPFDQLKPQDLEAIQTILTEMDLSKYDVSVGESTANPTARMANFRLALEMIKLFPDFGPYVMHLVVNMSDFSEKDEWIAAVKEAMEATRAQREEERLAKSQGNGGKPKGARQEVSAHKQL